MDWENYRPHAGDIMACYGVDWRSLGIRTVTSRLFAPSGLRFGPSHVAMIVPRSSNNVSRLMWGESTTMCGHPCQFHGVEKQGVQCHDLHYRINDYESRGGRVQVYRLHWRYTLTDNQSARLAGYFLNELVQDTKYDLAGAILSGGRISYATLSLLGINEERLFCSDLLAYLCQRIDVLPEGDPNEFTPAGLLRRLVRSGHYVRWEW
ncbi:hypothetical protein GYB59_22055 [bacterium]|nr:hypothetical protein [bacterium]